MRVMGTIFGLGKQVLNKKYFGEKILQATCQKVVSNLQYKTWLHMQRLTGLQCYLMGGMTASNSEIRLYTD